MIFIIHITNILIALATVLGLRGKRKLSWRLLGCLVLLLIVVELGSYIGTIAAVLLLLGCLMIFFYFDEAKRGDDLLRRVAPAFYYFLVMMVTEKLSGGLTAALINVTGDPYLLLGVSGLCQILLAFLSGRLVYRYLLQEARLSSYLLLTIGFAGFVYYFLKRGWIEWENGTSAILMRNRLLSASIGFMVILLAVLILSQLAYQQQLKLRQQQQDYETKRQELQQQVAVFQQNRRFKHNIQNSLIPVQQFLQESLARGGADEKALEQINAYYYQSLAGELATESVGPSVLIQLGNLPNPEVRDLLQMKLQELDPEKCQLTLQIEGLLDLTSAETPVMVEVLGLIMDNALEALASQEKGELIFEVYPEGNDTTLMIMNSIPEELPSLATLTRDGQSTKGSGRGLGLGLIQQLLVQVGFEHEVEAGDGYFSHTIRIAGDRP